MGERVSDAEALSLIGELAKAETIVRDLAATDPLQLGRRCVLCNADHWYVGHEVACPWLRAQQWVEANPE